MVNIETRKIRPIILIIVSLSLLLAACTPTTDTPVDSAPESAPQESTDDQALQPVGDGGRVIGSLVVQPSQPDFLFGYLASVARVESSEGWFFYLESNLAPTTRINPDGTFEFTNVPEAEYVLVVGVDAEAASAVNDPSTGEAFPFVVTAGDTVDVGNRVIVLSDAPVDLQPLDVETPEDGYPLIVPLTDPYAYPTGS